MGDSWGRLGAWIAVLGCLGVVLGRLKIDAKIDQKIDASWDRFLERFSQILGGKKKQFGTKNRSKTYLYLTQPKSLPDLQFYHSPGALSRAGAGEGAEGRGVSRASMLIATQPIVFFALLEREAEARELHGADPRALLRRALLLVIRKPATCGAVPKPPRMVGLPRPSPPIYTYINVLGFPDKKKSA